MKIGEFIFIVIFTFITSTMIPAIWFDLTMVMIICGVLYTILILFGITRVIKVDRSEKCKEEIRNKKED